MKHHSSTEALAAYAALVREWAPRLDLVAPGDLERFESRHIDDSLRLVELADELPNGPAVDVGSGAGLPGIPLAIAARPRPWTLLEPRRKRAAFLDEVVRALELDCEVLTLTAQEAAVDSALRASFAVAVARALAPPAEAFNLLMPLLGADGTAVVMLGEGAIAPPESREWTRGVATMASRTWKKRK